MNRIERKKMKKENRIKKIKNFFAGILSLFLLISLLYIGLKIVDETNRTMMMGESSFFSYNKIDEENLQVVFCGDKYLVNIEKIDILVSVIKEKSEYGIMNIKKFAHDKGKVVAKFFTSNKPK